MRLTLATYNIHGCIGMDGQYHPGRIIDVLRELDADIVAIQEVDSPGHHGLELLWRLANEVKLTPIAGRLPQGTPSPNALAVSPDGRRALLGLGGAAPGVLILDPLLLGDPEATDQQKLEPVATLSTSAAPIAFSVPNDGMRVIAVLENDRLAVIE